MKNTTLFYKQCLNAIDSNASLYMNCRKRAELGMFCRCGSVHSLWGHWPAVPTKWRILAILTPWCPSAVFLKFQVNSPGWSASFVSEAQHHQCLLPVCEQWDRELLLLLLLASLPWIWPAQPGKYSPRPCQRALNISQCSTLHQLSESVRCLRDRSLVCLRI